MIHAWHFLKDDGTTYNNHKPPSDGSMEKTEGPPILGSRGFHAFRNPLDALEYAGGSIVRRAIMSGNIIEENDKLVATQRRELWQADATITLHKFAVWCANQALLNARKARREPDGRSWAALQAKVDWLDGKITDQELAAASTAARDAMWEIAGDSTKAAARAIAKDAAWDMAWDTAWDTANAAVRAAGRNAAWTTVWNTVWSAQNKMLHKVLLALNPKKVGSNE